MVQMILNLHERVHLNSIVGMAIGEASANVSASEGIDTAAETPAAVGNRPCQRRQAEPVPEAPSKRLRIKTPTPYQ
jgi:hypothetical protein